MEGWEKGGLKFVGGWAGGGKLWLLWKKISCFEAKRGRLRLEESDFWDGPEKRMVKNKHRQTTARGKKPKII